MCGSVSSGGVQRHLNHSHTVHAFDRRALSCRRRSRRLFLMLCLDNAQHLIGARTARLVDKPAKVAHAPRRVRPRAVHTKRKLVRRAPLGKAASIEDKDRVRVDDSVQAVRDGEHRAACKLAAERPLDERVRVQVDVGGCFVDHENLVAAENGPREAYELALSHGKVRARLGQLRLEAAGECFDGGAQLDLRERLPQRLVRVLPKGVEVLAHRPAKEHGVLWDHRELAAEVKQANGRNFDPIDPNCTLVLHEPEQRAHERRLAAARAPNHADLGAARNLHGHARQRRRQFGTVAQRHVVEEDAAHRRPLLRRARLHNGLGLRLEARVFQHALHGRHVVLDLRALPHAPLEEARELQRVRQRQADKAAVQAIARKNGEKGGGCHKADAQKVEALPPCTLR
eukprot:Opistho-1_new@26621